MGGKRLYLRQWLHLRLRKRLIYPVCSRLYRDVAGGLDKSIMVAGAARSGTTWLADIIASQIPCRVMFEPFHANVVGGFHRLSYFQYMRPGEPNDDLYNFCHSVFTGSIKHRWIDREVGHIFPRYRLIKEIRANLFLGFRSIGLSYQDSVFRHVDRPSATTLSTSAIMTGKSKITGWRNDLSAAQIQAIASVVKGFGLDYIYGDSCTPLIAAPQLHWQTVGNPNEH